MDLGAIFGALSSALPQTAGLRQIGNPASGLGLLAALLGQGKGVLPPGTAEDQLEELNPGQKMFGIAPGQIRTPWATAPHTPDATGHSMLDHPGQFDNGVLSGQSFNIQGNTGTPINSEGGDVAVTGDGWHPRKQTVLGAIADGLLMSMGKKPLFSMMRDRRSMNEAMEGFTQDPKKAISRVGRIPGMEDQAWKMYGQYEDDQRADLAAQSLRDSRTEKFLQRKAGLLRSISGAKDPAAAYTNAMPILRRLSTLAGDAEDLPDTYDENYVNNYVSSSVDPEDQIRMEALARYRQDRLGLDERKVDMREHYQNERLQDFDAAQATRDKNANRPRKGQAAPGAGQLIRDPNGNVVGKTGASGKTAQLVAPDGGFQYFEVLPNGRLGKRLPNELFEKPKGK